MRTLLLPRESASEARPQTAQGINIGSSSKLRIIGTYTIPPTALCYDWEGLWEIVSVLATDIEPESSPWYQQRNRLEIYIVGKHDDDSYEIAIDKSFLPWLQARELPMNLDYDPVQPEKGTRAVFGAQFAMRKAREKFLERALEITQSCDSPGVRATYQQIVSHHNLHEPLNRLLLISDISVSFLTCE